MRTLVALLCSLPFWGSALAVGADASLCEIDAAEGTGPGWARREQVLEQIRATCRAGDVLRLFPFAGGGHSVDGAQMAPLVCRFDAQIMLIGEGDGARRLVCVYAGGTRRTR